MKAKIKDESGHTQTIEWNKCVVYKVYCNDDLNTLPIGILKDMRDYIDEVIQLKL